MEAEVIDIESIRLKRDNQRRAASAGVFGRLPCPCCDVMTSASGMTDGRIRFFCDGGGTHAMAEWTWDGADRVSDHRGRVRLYLGY
jgi:hypothetical protein